MAGAGSAMLLRPLSLLVSASRTKRRAVCQPPTRPGRSDGGMARGSRWNGQIGPSVRASAGPRPTYLLGELGPGIAQFGPSTGIKRESFNSPKWLPLVGERSQSCAGLRKAVQRPAVGAVLQGQSTDHLEMAEAGDGPGHLVQSKQAEVECCEGGGDLQHPGKD
jgi:hypothetical protein